MKDFVRIRLDVDAMKQSMITALSTRNDDLQAAVQRAVDAFMDGGIHGEIQSAVEDEIRHQVKSAMRNAVSAALRENQDLLNSLVAEAVRKQLWKYSNGEE